ncbi:MAG: glycosyltransferase family 9 protein [Deltaproteobacteria bacterium]|nr:glycosyltransferase family 9 protein [Deltaproteobacteria bacterium]
MRLKPVDNLLYLWMKARKAADKRATDISAFKPNGIKNILVVSSTAIGDTLLSTPAFRAVRKKFPKAKIIALLNKGNMELFENNPNLDGIVPYYGGYKRFFPTIKELKKFNFDLALIFHGNEPQATPMCYLAGAQFIMKLPNSSQYNFLLSNRSPIVKWEDMGHGITGRLMVAGLAHCRSAGERMELVIDEPSRKKAADYLAGEGVKKNEILIGFQAGASTVSRQWFAPGYIELGKRLLKDIPHSRVVITGSPSEVKLGSEIQKGIGDRAILAAGKLKLKEAAALIDRLDALVTGDTGPMHIAISLGTPVVALYAVADARKTGPLYDKGKHFVIQKPRTCEPCVSKKCEYQKCMEAISVDEVERAVKQVISK